MTALAPTLSLAETTTGSPWILGSITVEQGWARIVPGPAKTGAVYLTIHNKSAADDHLLAIESDAAGSAVLHESKNVNGIATMRPLPGGLTMPSHGEIVMKPGGIHIMLTAMLSPLKPRKRLPLRLIFRDAGEFDIEVPVLPLGEGGPPAEHSGHDS